MHDLQPEGSALFGAEPSFKSDFSLDPEEARAQAASRRASRMQSREASVAPVESLGILYISSVPTEMYNIGYCLRSRPVDPDVVRP